MSEKKPSSAQPQDRGGRRWKRTDLLLPTRAVRRAADSLDDARNSVVDLFAQMRNGMPGRQKQGEGQSNFAQGDPRAIEDSRERFEAIYLLNGWSRKELSDQLSAVRRTKLAALVMSAGAFAAVVTAMFILPVWLLLVVMPTGGCVLIIGLAQAFKFSHYQAQLEMRSLISAREFASLPDFFERLIR